MPHIPHKFARAASGDTQRAPRVEVRFFYASPLPIDDPLSPVPPPLNTPSFSVKLPPRPFSEYDNIALDKAWNDLRQKILKYKEQKDTEKVNESVNRIATERRRTRMVPGSHRSPGSSAATPPPTPPGHRGIVKTSQGMSSRSQDYGHRRSVDESSDSSLQSSSLQRSLKALDVTSSPELVPVLDATPEGLTGMPFVRAPSRKKVTGSIERGITGRMTLETQGFDEDFDNWEDDGLPQHESAPEGPITKVPVGVSRLHQVAMPNLHMEPIYWQPVHDISTVVRGTWFYKDTMLPVEVEVANMLEASYHNIRPWTEAWNDELNSAIEVGAAGEEKISHPLWPEQSNPASNSRPGTSSSVRPVLDESTPEKKRKEIVQAVCDYIDVAMIADNIDAKATGSNTFGRDGQHRLYIGSQVIYANEREAYILRPNLQPSAYYGRRPLANYIRKDRSIGISVIRGFDQDIWDKFNPPKSGPKAAKAQEGVSTSQAGPSLAQRMQSDPSLGKARNPKVTDLILVIHGIGQKLSERVESFHFTHAMNAFRREVNVELGTNSVKAHLRDDMGGIMLLPVNWRFALSFEEGGYREDGPDKDVSSNKYNLKDITPETLPSVRNIISDVMLDIPYYLSHHQPTMLVAVIREANRIYRLWCQNNPGFERDGRVHLMAHSLGSVMALDILSKQPTHVSPLNINLNLNPTTTDPSNNAHFTFNTRNLYLCGSPAGFFLLLQKAALLPRTNPSTDSTDAQPGVAGEQGTYGCLALENIYNIINPYDPVAYRLNATVDAAYAASLKPALIPSASTSWFGSISNPFSSFSSSSPTSTTFSPSITTTTTPPQIVRLPSTVELETHNFSREEIAEKRMFLLNDAGQIDFLLRYGGGPLEIQYLTMLGAHSSYWVSRDFVRFVVVETGRREGREGVVERLRARKMKVGER